LHLIQPNTIYRELLKYLDQKAVKATFFVVGSRVVERPAILIEEYMSGHEISVHTWSHRLLTTLTTPQIVAELGFTREVIRKVLGVSPTTMRPPQGDIGMYPITNAPKSTGRPSYQTTESVLSL
jgi:peptidoglycan/xylan/chitin deacetylase (PgdA/CDA1 family)